MIKQLSKRLKIVQAPKPPNLGALSPVPPRIGGLGGPATDIVFSRKHLSTRDCVRQILQFSHRQLRHEGIEILLITPKHDSGAIGLLQGELG